MPKRRVDPVKVKAAEAAGPPPIAAGLNNSEWHCMQSAWMAAALPHVNALPDALPVGKRRDAWKAAKKKYFLILPTVDATDEADVAMLDASTPPRVDSHPPGAELDEVMELQTDLAAGAFAMAEPASRKRLLQPSSSVLTPGGEQSGASA